MQIDSHQHFWKYSPEEYPWMTDSMSVLRRDQLPGDLEPLLKTAGFGGTIAVQARQTTVETEWLLKLAAVHECIRGVVGWVDLRSPRVGEDLERYAKHPKLSGVRHVVHDEADDHFMLLPEFRRGISKLRRHNLTYDLLLFPRHLSAASQLAREFPDQPFVLDHLAKPGIRDRKLSPWREDIRKLAALPNVHCKLSGMVTEARWHQWRPDDFRIYLDTVLEAFGAKRVMIGSDWPVCTLSGDYLSTMNVVMDYVRQFTAKVQADILGGNCARFYNIPSPDRGPDL